MTQDTGQAKPTLRGSVVLAVATLATVVAFGVVDLVRGDRRSGVDSVPTTAEPWREVGFLVADGSSILEVGSGSALLDAPVRVVYDDLTGGVLYQTGSNAYFGDTTETDVWHLPTGAQEPVKLMPQNGDATLRLMGAFDVEGVATAIVVERQNPNDVDNTTEVMYEVDLGSGTRRRVADVGGWEKGRAAISWDGARYVVSSFAEGFTFLDTVSREGDLQPWNEGGLGSECHDEPHCVRVAVATADGEHLVYTRGDLVDTTELVLWNRRAGTEVWSVELDGGPVLGPIATADETIVVNHYAESDDAPGIARASIVELASGRLTHADEAGFLDPYAG